jgi:hypothetical protein
MEIIKESHWLKGGRRINKANVVFHPCSEETGLSDIPPSSGNTGRGEAARLKAWIENDVKHGYYDPTLVKYGLGDRGQKTSDLTTVELFDRFNA